MTIECKYFTECHQKAVQFILTDGGGFDNQAFELAVCEEHRLEVPRDDSHIVGPLTGIPCREVTEDEFRCAIILRR